MPLLELENEPDYMTIEDHTRLQEATPSSFLGHAPVLRLKLDQIQCCMYPESSFQIGESSRSVENGSNVGSLITKGTLWITDDQIAFLPSSGKGFSVDYPSLSLHAISRSLPPSLISSLTTIDSPESLTSPGCLYCQLEEEDNGEDDEEMISFQELWILPAQQDLLEPLFEALSYCASLHPSKRDNEDEGEGGGHPFGGIGPFGTRNFNNAEAVSDGAFDDADEEGEGATDDAGIELSNSGRTTLARLDFLLEQNQDQCPIISPEVQSSPPASFHSADPRNLAQKASSNSLILVQVPDEVFTFPSLAASLLDLLHAFGNLASWSPLPSFNRALIIYEEVEGAQRAKEALDRLILPLVDEGATSEQILDETGSGISIGTDDKNKKVMLRAFYGPMTVIKNAEEEHLAVPSTDRNFLISPPGSPPIGWEPIKEDPPNRDTLADDLIRALGSLRDKGLGVHSNQPRPLTKESCSKESITDHLLLPPTLVIAPSQAKVYSRHPLVIKKATHSQGEEEVSSTISIPGVVVQSVESDSGEDILDERFNKGLSISSVKATVDSMKGSLAFSSTASKITPTGRPPLA